MRIATTAAAALVMVCTPAWAQKEFSATLAGPAILPAETFIDAPADLKVSDKYTTDKRIETIGSVMGKSFEHPTGVALPFKGQPIQAIRASRSCPMARIGSSPITASVQRPTAPTRWLYLNRCRIDWAANT